MWNGTFLVTEGSRRASPQKRNVAGTAAHVPEAWLVWPDLRWE